MPDAKIDSTLDKLMRFISRRPETKLGQIVVIAFWFFFLLLALFSAAWRFELLPWVDYDRESSPTVSRIVAILPLSGPDSWSGNQIRSAIEYAREDHCIQNTAFCSDVEIEFVDDRGDPDVAIERARAISARSDVVAVIGHFSSAVTEQALAEYCRDDVQMPIIMPVPTATHISHVARNLGCLSSIRLPPSNRTQGQQLAELLLHIQRDHPNTETQNSRRYVALFRDQNNAAYSNSLGREFASAISDSDGLEYNLAVDIAISGQSGGLIITDTIAQFEGVDVWVIAGMTPAVLQTLRQAAALGFLPEHVILTDGAISEQLTIEGRDVIGSNIHLLFQTPPDSQRFDQIRRYAAHDSSPLTFAPYGNDAYVLLTMLIEEIATDGYSISRSELAQHISDTILPSNGSRTQYPEEPSENLTLGQFSFDHVGNNHNIRYSYYVYEDQPSYSIRNFRREELDE